MVDPHFIRDLTPESHFLCCLCWTVLPLTEANPLPEGEVEDVCRPCAAEEFR